MQKLEILVCWGTRGIGALGKSELLVRCRSARYWCAREAWVVEVLGKRKVLVRWGSVRYWCPGEAQCIGEPGKWRNWCAAKVRDIGALGKHEVLLHWWRMIFWCAAEVRSISTLRKRESFRLNRLDPDPETETDSTRKFHKTRNKYCRYVLKIYIFKNLTNKFWLRNQKVC